MLTEQELQKMTKVALGAARDALRFRDYDKAREWVSRAGQYLDDLKQKAGS